MGNDEQQLDSATRDLQKTGDERREVDAVCASGLPWTGEEVQLSNDSLAVIPSDGDAAAADSR